MLYNKSFMFGYREKVYILDLCIHHKEIKMDGVDLLKNLLSEPNKSQWNSQHIYSPSVTFNQVGESPSIC